MLGWPQGSLCSCSVASRQTVCRISAVVDVAMAQRSQEEMDAALTAVQNELARMNTQEVVGARLSRASEPTVVVPPASTNVALP